MFLEIFKTGVHTDSRGISGEYPAENLDRIAVNYSKRTAENPDDKAPLVLGHPDSGDGAKGWVRKLFRRGNSLVADVEIIDEDFKKSLRSGEFRNISIAIDSDMNFIHLGFLGAVVPAVQGLNPMKYSAVSNFEIFDDNLIILSDENPHLNEKLSELESRNQQFSGKIEEYERQLQRIEFSGFIKSVYDNSGVKFFSNKQSDYFIELLEMGAGLDKSNNTADKHTSRVREIIKEFAKNDRKLEFSGYLSPKQGYSLIDARVEPERNSIHLKAIELMKEMPDISYEDALCLTTL